jgi:hypothetical protein
MLIMSSMLVMPTLLPFAANTEVFMLLPLLGLLALISWKGSRASGAWWFVAGVSSAGAVLYKPIAVLVILAMFAGWIIETRKAGTPGLTRRILLAAGGGVLTTVLVLAPFLLHDGGRTLWECVWRYNVQYAQLENPGSGPFLFFLERFWQHWWLLFLLLLWLLLRRPSGWWLPVGLLAASLLTIYNASLGHYYIMAVPFLAMASGMALNDLFVRFAPFFSREGSLKRGVAIVVAALVVLYPSRELLLKTPGELTESLYTPYNPFLEARVLATHVAELSAPTEKVFVAGSEPELLFYAKRKSATRFVIMYPLMLTTPAAMPYQEEVVRALRANPPEVIVVVRSKLSWLQEPGSPRLLPSYLNKLLAEEYRLAGGTMFDTKEWHTTLDAGQDRRASMLLYKRSPRDSAP